MPEAKLTLSGWRERVGEFPALLDHVAYDLFCEGRSPANALAEAVKTLHAVGKTGRTQHGSKVPYRTQHAVQEALVEWRAIEFVAGASGVFPLDAKLALSLDEAADSMRKATMHEPVGKKALWKHKGWQLPAYIQHIANDLREKRGMTESRAIATAIAAVKRWAAGGGNVHPDTRAAAAKAVAEWEKLKAKAKGSREAKLVGAASRLTHIVQPMPDQATFALRYANRLTVIEGVLSALRSRKPLAVKAAAQLLEAGADTSITDLIEELADRKQEMLLLMEALGYGSTPIRARTSAHKGKFHGMHGVERAVKKRSHVPDSGEEHPVLVALSAGERLREAEMILEAAPSLAPAPVSAGGSAAFEQLHPRAAHGQFGSKGGAAAPAAGADGGGGGHGSAELAAAIQANDPQFTKDMQATSAFAAAHQSGQGAQQTVLAGEMIQNVGYSNDAGGIAQFQKDEGLPVTGKLDTATLATVQTVYRQNARYAASRVPDFTGIKGAGARIGGARKSSHGRSTLGKTSAAKINEGFEDALQEESILFSTRSGAPINFGRPSGMPPLDDDESSRQPGGDDFNFDEVPREPVGFREGDGTHVCATCVHFSPKGWITSANIQGGCMAFTYPVERDDVCDDWLTLTPPDAPLRVFESQLTEAMVSGIGDEIVAARAALKYARSRYPQVDPLPHPASEWLFEALVELRIEERDVSAAERQALAKKGQTLQGSESYPIKSLKDLDNAIQAWGRAKPRDRPALKRLLAKMARKLHAPQEVVARIRGLTVQSQAA